MVCCKRPKGKILIVDDEFYLRELLSDVLESKGYETAGAQDGEECVKLNSSKNYDAIFLDVRMPQMDGISTLKNLRLQGISTPVILMSGYGQVSSAKEARELGACTFMKKPFLPDDALKKLANLV